MLYIGCIAAARVDAAWSRCWLFLLGRVDCVVLVGSVRAYMSIARV